MNAPLAAFMIAAFAMGAAVACAGAPLATRAGGDTVAIDNFTFGPDRLTVKVGTTVIWTNRDDIPHTVASPDRLFKSRAMDTDESFSFTFTTSGVYPYFCSLHPHMTGTIVVEGAPKSGATQ